MGDFVLELFWRDGCEPTVSPLLDYSQAGLCRHYAQNAHTDGGPGPGIAALKAPAS
jgi:hypothetical protein